MAGAPLQTELEQLLEAVGLERVLVPPKPEAAEFIAGWMPGSGAEQYIVSADVTAYKPEAGAAPSRLLRHMPKKPAPNPAKTAGC